MNDQQPSAHFTDPGTGLVANIYELAFPSRLRTGSMGEADLLLEASDRSKIVYWGDLAYDIPQYFSSQADFNFNKLPYENYPVEIFVIVAYENNSGAVVRDAYVYAYLSGRTASDKVWRLVAVCQRGIADDRRRGDLFIECAYLDPKHGTIVFCNRNGKVHTRLPMHNTMEYLKQNSKYTVPEKKPGSN